MITGDIFNFQVSYCSSPNHIISQKGGLQVWNCRNLLSKWDPWPAVICKRSRRLQPQATTNQQQSATTVATWWKSTPFVGSSSTATITSCRKQKQKQLLPADHNGQKSQPHNLLSGPHPNGNKPRASGFATTCYRYYFRAQIGRCEMQSISHDTIAKPFASLQENLRIQRFHGIENC